jgi:Protein of unknown function (DUF2384)
MAKEKNPHAVALSILGAKKGGKARAAALSAEQRREIARKASLARWGKEKKQKGRLLTPSHGLESSTLPHTPSFAPHLAQLHKYTYGTPYMETDSKATLQPPFARLSAQRTADLSSHDVQERLSRSAIPAFFKLAQAWQLRDESTRQLLGGVSNGVFYQLKRGHKKTLDQDKLTRISLLLGIFKALNVLYSRKLADVWVNLPNSNPMFEGEVPLLYMIKGGVPALVRVRQLLDARRGGR